MKKEKKSKKELVKSLKWALSLSLIVIFSLILCQYAVGYGMLAILGAERLQQPVWTTVYSAITYVLCIVIVLFTSRKFLKQKNTRESLGLSDLPTWLDLGLAPVGFFAYYVAAIIAVMIAMPLFPHVNWQQVQEVGFTNLIGTGDKILALVSLVVVAPIFEEIIFRGWFYGKLRMRFSAWVSILVDSLVFALLHLGFNFEALQWNVALNVFCMSVVLCLMRELRGTIWSGIVLHILKNGVAYYLLFISGTTLFGN